MNKYNRRHVLTVNRPYTDSGSATLANVVNVNAEILKEVLDRLDILEVGTKYRVLEEIETIKKDMKNMK